MIGRLVDRTWLRAVLGLIVCASLLAGCEAEIKRVPATQTLIRIEADPEVRAALSSLRVRTAAPQGGSWMERNSQEFAADVLQWPVDIVVQPSSEAEADKRFEVIAEALGEAGQALVQTRAVTGFVLREQRMLVLTLATCGARALGYLCEQDPACLGPTCSTCVGGGCAPTPVFEPTDLAHFDGTVAGAVPDAQVGTAADAGMDAAPDLSEPDASGFDAMRPELVGMDAGPDSEQSEPPVTCAHGSEMNEAGACVDIDECARATDDCDDQPEACVNAQSGLGFTCACPSGYRGTGHGAEGCADIDECKDQTDSCGDLVVCNNSPGSYSCGSCPAGYSPDASGDCKDINECGTNNGGCDTSPMATCNNVVGGSNTCTCPPGYSGNGVGAGGCIDVNECGANNGGCDTSPMAACNNVTGGPNTCSCPDGYLGNGVGASGCSDENECGTNNGGCDTSPTAACNNVTGGPNTCSCPPGYSGNGVGASGCTDVNECGTNNGGCSTSPKATCNNVVGGPNTCTCPSGYSGDGKGPGSCVDTPDCNASSCQHGGQCIEQVNGFSCNCAGTGYTGSNCQTDPCSPNPCGAGLSCARTPSGTASCTASCLNSGIGCQPGDTCVTDADCKSGGDNSATCEPTAKVCVRVCEAMTIVSQDNLEAARYCKEIDGDLKIEPAFATLPATALPYLTRVRGSLLALNPFGTPDAISITLGALQTVDGEVKFGVMTNLTTLSLPRLTTAGAVAMVTMLKVTRISLPLLTTSNGMFALGNLPLLGQVDIGRLNSVAGQLSLQALCKLPYSQVQRISTLGSSQTVTNIGCCTTSSDRFDCGSLCTCN